MDPGGEPDQRQLALTEPRALAFFEFAVPRCVTGSHGARAYRGPPPHRGKLPCAAGARAYRGPPPQGQAALRRRYVC